jgi:hypothetical protein
MKKEGSSDKKIKFKNYNWFAIAFWSGIILVLFYFFSSIFTQLLYSNTLFLSTWNILSIIISNALMIIFSYGFYVLGNKYNKAFLKIVSLLIIVFIIISILVSMFFVSPIISDLTVRFTEKATNFGLTENTSSSEVNAFWDSISTDPSFMSPFFVIIGFLLVGFLFFCILSILFGASLISLNDKVRYAKLTGVLEIVGGASCLTILGALIGVPLMIVAFVFELIILFNESKK